MIVPMAYLDGSLSFEHLVYVSHLSRCEMRHTKNKDRWKFPGVGHLFLKTKLKLQKEANQGHGNELTGLQRGVPKLLPPLPGRHCEYVLYVPLPFRSISKWIQGYNLLKLMAVKRRNLKEKEPPPSYWITEQTDYLYSKSP
jgi:hypothetical protein